MCLDLGPRVLLVVFLSTGGGEGGAFIVSVGAFIIVFSGLAFYPESRKCG